MNEQYEPRPTRPWPPAFTSTLKPWEAILMIAYLPVHIYLLPLLITRFFPAVASSLTQLNFVVYVVGVLFTLIVAGRFLRRDFDPLCDSFFRIILEIIICYGLMIGFNVIVNMLLLAAAPDTNPNNATVMEMAGVEFGKTAALAIFMAPLVEEVIFRGGIFGSLRKWNRVLAYTVSALLFAFYHVYSYAIQDPAYWLYILQYIPVSLLLCRCYERCNTIWASIFFHMLVNGISIQALSLLEDLL